MYEAHSIREKREFKNHHFFLMSLKTVYIIDEQQGNWFLESNAAG